MSARYFALGFLLLLAACTGKAKNKSGSEQGPCYGNGTCDEGLSCLSQTCVQAPGSTSLVDQNIGALRDEIRDLEGRLSQLEAKQAEAPKGLETDPVASLQLLNKAPAAKQPTVPKARPDSPDLVNPFNKPTGQSLRAPSQPSVRIQDRCNKNPDLPECMLD